MSNKLSILLSNLRSENQTKENVIKVFYKDTPSELYVIVNNYFDKSFPEVISEVSANVSKYEKDNKENIDLHFLPNDPEVIKDVEQLYKAQEFAI